MFTGPGSDAWLQPPEAKTPPSGDAEITIERPVPLVGEPEDGWREYRVSLEMDEGRVFRATVVGGGEVELTDGEREAAEMDWAEDCAAHPDEPDREDR